MAIEPHRDMADNEVVEIDDDEFPGYFAERNGRLFHSHGSSPYPLPVDGHEQQRVNGQHGLLREHIGGNYVRADVVQRVLQPSSGLQRCVLDMGTGTGIWVEEMAEEFPHVRFYGVDIVPIATRHPPRNVFFEMHDLSEKCRFSNGYFDLIHARSVSMAIRDYPRLLNEAARLLRPDGVFLACEWGRTASMIDQGLDPAEQIPRTKAFYDMVTEALRRRGILPVAANIVQFLQHTGQFGDIQVREYRIPIGGWPDEPEMRQRGLRLRELCTLYAESMKVMMVRSRLVTDADADLLMNGFIDEMYNVEGMACIYYTVYARKI